MTAEAYCSRSKPNILIVDDVPASLELLACIIRGQGCEPRPVPSGKLALLAAQADPPDIILLDVNMPDMNGFEVFERLKSDERLKDIPVIFITALSEIADKVKAFSMGAADYITKPFQTEEIESRVRTQLRIRAMQLSLSERNADLEKLVAERTLELEQAYRQLQRVDKLKDDFMHMISHEIRTPANGILGIGGLVLDICPDSEEKTLFADHFEKSSLRLRNLIKDATMLSEVDELRMKGGAAISFALLLDNVRTSLPEIRITADEQTDTIKADLLFDCCHLLNSALKTIILLAAAFSRNKNSVHVIRTLESGFMRVRLDLDALSLSENEVSDFFQIESLARASSSAEALGLSPVVAHKIITDFGGELKLVKLDGNTGCLEAKLLRECGK
jgi:two-component system sensor histidine kinase/response regulator